MISVIIPAYNAEKYIDRCLESVLTQQDAHYEVIVVNDGSTDRTGNICLKWKEQSRKLIYIEQENMGQGTARNVAISHARGEWLAFLDADDEMVPDALKRLEKVADEQTDIVWYEFWLLKQNTSVKERIRIVLEDPDRQEILSETTTFLWDKMIRRSYWQENEICLCNDYGEDMVAIYQLLSGDGRIRLLRIPLVVHYDRENSLSANADKVIQILQTTRSILDKFVEKKEFFKYIDGFFFLIFKQYRLYQLDLKTAVLDQEQYDYLMDGFLKLLREYFPEKWKIAQKLIKKDLIVIGRLVMPGYICRLFHAVIGYSSMDSYLFVHKKKSSEGCVYCIDVSNEAKSSLHGTRSEEWDLNHWREACQVFAKRISNDTKIEQVFLVRDENTSYAKLQQEMEVVLKDRVNAVQLKETYSVFHGLENKKPYVLPVLDKNIPEVYYEGSAECLRYEYMVNVMNSWLKVRNGNRSLYEYLKYKGYNRIAVYGVGFLGERLIEELCPTDIEIAYLIDKTGKSYMDIPVLSLGNDLPYVDVIIVSVVHLYQWIECEIKKVSDMDVMSLEDVVLAALK